MNQAMYAVLTMCRVLEVSASGYHAWCKRQASTRALEDAALTLRIQAIHQRSRETYGAPRVHAELRDQGTAISRKRVARLMRLAGLKGISRRQGTVTTVRDPQAHAAEDDSLLRTNSHQFAPRIQWGAD